MSLTAINALAGADGAVHVEALSLLNNGKLLRTDEIAKLKTQLPPAWQRLGEDRASALTTSATSILKAKLADLENMDETIWRSLDNFIDYGRGNDFVETEGRQSGLAACGLEPSHRIRTRDNNSSTNRVQSVADVQTPSFSTISARSGRCACQPTGQSAAERRTADFCSRMTRVDILARYSRAASPTRHSK